MSLTREEIDACDVDVAQWAMKAPTETGWEKDELVRLAFEYVTVGACWSKRDVAHFPDGSRIHFNQLVEEAIRVAQKTRERDLDEVRDDLFCWNQSKGGYNFPDNAFSTWAVLADRILEVEDDDVRPDANGFGFAPGVPPPYEVDWVAADAAFNAGLATPAAKAIHAVAKATYLLADARTRKVAADQKVVKLKQSFEELEAKQGTGSPAFQVETKRLFTTAKGQLTRATNAAEKVNKEVVAMEKKLQELPPAVAAAAPAAAPTLKRVRNEDAAISANRVKLIPTTLVTCAHYKENRHVRFHPVNGNYRFEDGIKSLPTVAVQLLSEDELTQELGWALTYEKMLAPGDLALSVLRGHINRLELGWSLSRKRMRRTAVLDGAVAVATVVAGAALVAGVGLALVPGVIDAALSTVPSPVLWMTGMSTTAPAFRTQGTAKMNTLKMPPSTFQSMGYQVLLGAGTAANGAMSGALRLLRRKNVAAIENQNVIKDMLAKRTPVWNVPPTPTPIVPAASSWSAKVANAVGSPLAATVAASEPCAVDVIEDIVRYVTRALGAYGVPTDDFQRDAWMGYVSAQIKRDAVILPPLLVAQMGLPHKNGGYDLRIVTDHDRDGKRAQSLVAALLPVWETCATFVAVFPSGSDTTPFRAMFASENHELCLVMAARYGEREMADPVFFAQQTE